jgi:hypothetical protein
LDSVALLALGTARLALRAPLPAPGAAATAAAPVAAVVTVAAVVAAPIALATSALAVSVATSLALPGATPLALPVATALTLSIATRLTLSVATPLAVSIAMAVAFPVATPLTLSGVIALTGLTARALLPAAGGLRSPVARWRRRAWPTRRRSRLGRVARTAGACAPHWAREFARCRGHAVPHWGHNDRSRADDRPSNCVVRGRASVHVPSPSTMRHRERSSPPSRADRYGRNRAADRGQAGRRQAGGAV